MAAMCTDAYREALTRALSSTASPAPAPAVAKDATAVNGEARPGGARRRLEVVSTYEGTGTIQSLIAGRDVTGISAFS